MNQDKLDIDKIQSTRSRSISMVFQIQDEPTPRVIHVYSSVFQQLSASIYGFMWVIRLWRRLLTIFYKNWKEFLRASTRSQSRTMWSLIWVSTLSFVRMEMSNWHSQSFSRVCSKSIRKNHRAREPLSPQRLQATHSTNAEPMQPSAYLHLEGALIYLTKSRPDIHTAVSFGATHSVTPTREDFEELIHCLKYLEATQEEGLVLKAGEPSRELISLILIPRVIGVIVWVSEISGHFLQNLQSGSWSPQVLRRVKYAHYNLWSWILYSS